MTRSPLAIRSEHPISRGPQGPHRNPRQPGWPKAQRLRKTSRVSCPIPFQQLQGEAFPCGLWAAPRPWPRSQPGRKRGSGAARGWRVHGAQARERVARTAPKLGFLITLRGGGVRQAPRLSPSIQVKGVKEQGGQEAGGCLGGGAAYSQSAEAGLWAGAAQGAVGRAAAGLWAGRRAQRPEQRRWRCCCCRRAGRRPNKCGGRPSPRPLACPPSSLAARPGPPPRMAPRR